MQNTESPKLEFFIKKLPIINMFFLTPIIGLKFMKDSGDPLTLLIILSVLSLSIMATIYRIRVAEYDKVINPKRFLILSVCIAVSTFVIFYFGCKSLGWLEV